MDVPNLSSFGDVLKRFRREKKLTQQQLAKLVGASRNALSFWERGEYLPETLATVLELARVLHLNEEEQRLLIEARFGTASILPLHNLPAPNPYFTGREETLRSLHAQLSAGQHMALIQPQAISGLGGIGKTQVAMAYAYRFHESYHDILWVAADSRETLITSYLTLAQHLRLREQEEREMHKVIEALKRWLREHKGWLLILDNLEDLELVREFVPTPRQGTLLITTRRQETRPVAHPLRLEAMSEEEGSLFLLRRAGSLAKEAALETASAEHRAVARAIVQTLGGLPLALDQAGAYVTETQRSLSEYLDLFKQRRAALLDRRGTLSPDHPLSVSATFSLAVEQVHPQNEAASDLLKLCACLAPDAIPLELITQGAAHLGTVLGPVAVDALHLDQALETLQAYSLVRRDAESRTFSIHRLVQAVILETMSERQRSQWRERVVRAINEAFPEGEFEEWTRCERLLPHVLVCANWIENKPAFPSETSHVLDKAGIYLRERGQYLEAEPLLVQALSISEQHLGAEHPDTAKCMHNLAILYSQQGKYEQAEPLFLRALAIHEQHLGPEHLSTARSLNSLAAHHFYQGKYEQAELLYQRALAIREQHLGLEHPDTAVTLDNLAIIYQRQGKYEQAESLFLRALAIHEQYLGPEHPETATSLDNLAALYPIQGKYEQAECLFLRALTIREQYLGPEHPDTAMSLNNLAELYRHQEKCEQAESLYKRALAICEQHLGAEHPDTADTLHGLAELYQCQGKYEQAEPLYQRALAICEQHLGAEHPDLADTLHGLASLFQYQGKNEQAEALYQRALSIWERVYGPNHTKTTETRLRLRAVLVALGWAEEATRLDVGQAEPVKTEEHKTQQEE